MLPDLSLLWSIVPDPVRPFILPAAFCLYLYFFFANRRTDAEAKANRWASENAINLRNDNDRQTGRITGLEQAMADLRERYEGILDRLRADLDRGWDLARDWCATAHDQRHWINNKLMLIPEDQRPEALPPLPACEQRPGVRPDEFPVRFQAPPVRDQA